MNGTARRFGASALAGLALLVAGPLAAQGGPERFTLRGERAAVYNLAGEVRVEAGSGSEVEVEVVRGGSDAGELRIEQDRDGGVATLRIVTPGDRVVYPRMGARSSTSLRVRRDGSFGGGMGARSVTIRSGGRGTEAYADVRVRVPRGRSVSIHLGVGRVAAANVDGTLRLHTASAPVEVSGTRGSLGVDVGSGSVRVQGAQGDVDVDTGSGSVRVAGVRGPRLRVDTGSGSVSAADLQVQSLHVDVGSGGVELRGVRAEEVLVDTGSGSVQIALVAPARSVKVDTGSGSVRLEVPPAQGAELEIDTGSGGIAVELPVEGQRSRRSHFRGRIGDGRGHIRIDTGSGGVRVTRS